MREDSGVRVTEVSGPGEWSTTRYIEPIVEPMPGEVKSARKWSKKP